MLKQNTTYNLIRNISIVLLFPSDAWHMTAFNHQVLPCQQQLRHYAGQGGESLRWRWWLFGTLLLCHAEIVGCWKGGGAAQRDGGSPAGQREVLVGQSVVTVGGR